VNLATTLLSGCDGSSGNDSSDGGLTSRSFSVDGFSRVADSDSLIGILVGVSAYKETETYEEGIKPMPEMFSNCLDDSYFSLSYRPI